MQPTPKHSFSLSGRRSEGINFSFDLLNMRPLRLPSLRGIAVLSNNLSVWSKKQRCRSHFLVPDITRVSGVRAEDPPVTPVYGSRQPPVCLPYEAAGLQGGLQVANDVVPVLGLRVVRPFSQAEEAPAADPWKGSRGLTGLFAIGPLTV